MLGFLQGPGRGITLSALGMSLACQPHVSPSGFPRAEGERGYSDIWRLPGALLGVGFPG